MSKKFDIKIKRGSFKETQEKFLKDNNLLNENVGGMVTLGALNNPFPTRKQIKEYRIQKAEDIKADPRIWQTLKYELQKQFYELEKIGPDFGVFKSAQGTHKILKQIKKLIHKL